MWLLPHRSLHTAAPARRHVCRGGVAISSGFGTAFANFCPSRARCDAMPLPRAAQSRSMEMRKAMIMMAMSLRGEMRARAGLAWNEHTGVGSSHSRFDLAPLCARRHSWGPRE